MSMKKKTNVAAILLALGITAVLTAVLNYVFRHRGMYIQACAGLRSC